MDNANSNQYVTYVVLTVVALVFLVMLKSFFGKKQEPKKPSTPAHVENRVEIPRSVQIKVEGFVRKSKRKAVGQYLHERNIVYHFVETDNRVTLQAYVDKVDLVVVQQELKDKFKVAVEVK